MDISHILRTVGDPLCPGREADVALSEEDGSAMTYAELRASVEATAGGLRRAGVHHGDRVGLLLRNSCAYWVYYFAVTSLGAIAVKLNWRLTSEELEYAIDDSGTSVLLVDADLVEQVAFCSAPHAAVQVFAVVDRPSGPLPGWAADAGDLLLGEPLPLNDVPWPDSTPAAMMYTSGTTGRPKGAVWTHGNVTAYAAMQVMKWGFDQRTRALTMGPFYHVGGFENLLLPTLLVKGQAVFMRSGGFSIDRCIEVLAQRRIDSALLYPFAIAEMMDSPLLGEVDLSRLQLLVTGGSAISLPTLEKLRKRLPHVGLVQTYGLTEGGAISTASDPGDVESCPEAVGQAFSLTEVRVVRDGDLTGVAGEVGEVLVRSPSVAACYWGRPDESKETFADGWCRTGDLGRITEEGRLVIAGRKKDMIRSGGENIYPAELEMVLGQHPAVGDIAIIGVPDQKYQEAVCAVVVTAPGHGLTVEEFAAYARTRLAGYKCPRHLVLVDELPRNASGKVLKFRLRDLYADTGGDGVPS